jgi:hypothetical protein
MSAPSCTRDEFLSLWEKHRGNAAAIAKELKLTSSRSVFERRRNMERTEGVILRASGKELIKKLARKPRLHTEVKNGVAIVASDCHYWPGDPTTAHRALLKFIRRCALTSS